MEVERERESDAAAIGGRKRFVRSLLSKRWGMMKNNAISPDLLHKGSADDVLICFPRVALPLYMEELDVKPFADSAILRNYVPCEKRRLRFNISQDIQRKSFIGGSLLSDIKVDEDWNKVRAIPYQIVEHTLPREGKASNLNDSCLNNEVAMFYDAIPEFRRASSFQLVNNADHYFFYRKAHEHVPGTMFIEAARQAVYHHLYTHTNHVRGEVTVSLNELNANFYAYAELMYPIELVVDDLSHADAPSPNKIHYRVAFYQKQNLFAIIDTKASIIDIRRFEKIRNIFIFSDDWFSPINQSKISCMISTTDGQECDVTLLGISKNGCITTSPDIDVNKAGAMRILYDGKLSCSVNVQHRKQDKHSTWDFANIAFNDLQGIGEIVKRGFIQLDVTAISTLAE